jgi:glycosyltransferase involved in cell wall biosynthesis
MTSNFPLVSIHLISYNQVAYIRPALMSILEQDYPNLEIVAADDGSTDGTAEIIQEMARDYPGKIILLLGEKNLGITANCNRGLAHCRGKYIAFIGGDDLFLPDKISKQVAWLEADQRRVMCGHQVEVFYEDGSPSHRHSKNMCAGIGPKRLIQDGLPFSALSIMVRGDRVPAGGFNSALPLVSDGLFFTETLIPNGNYGYIDGVHARYRKHASNITNQWDRCVDDFSKYFEIVRNKYPQYAMYANKGEANILVYGRGLRLLQNGKRIEALQLFIRGLRVNPTGWKLWVRLFQAMVWPLSRTHR